MPHTLLLADDSVTIQRVIELTFAEEDVQVVAVSDGDQAILRLESAPPDIVLADIGMPGRDGYEVARYVRQTPKLAHIPVVLLTGAFEPVDQAKANEVGCDGVLAKPFEPQLVIGRVRELLAAPSRRVAQPVDVPMPLPVMPEPPASPFSDEPAKPAASGAVASTNLDEYFDRLDTAFANMSGQASADAPVSAPSSAAPPPPPADAPAIDLPLSYTSPAPPDPSPAPVSAGVAAPPTFATPVAPAEPVVRELPSVAEAFAAILAAEQRDEPSPRPVWPTPAASVNAAPAAISDELVEQIAERVLARISVGDRVNVVAERLVREEIERIKASIK